jgi:hypothetical protein
MVVSPAGTGTKYHCVGEDQQQFSSQSVLCRMSESAVTISVALLEAATKQRLVKKTEREDLVCAVVICGVFRLVDML